MHEDGRESRPRISYLCNPLDHTELVRIPNELINAWNPVRKESPKHQESTKVMTATEHLDSWLADTYGWGKQDNPAQDHKGMQAQ